MPMRCRDHGSKWTRAWAGWAAGILWAAATAWAEPPAAVPLPDPAMADALTGDWAADPATLSDAVATARLRAGVLCVGWARDMIDQHWRLLDRHEGAGTWSPTRQTLWLQMGWVDDFERRYLRPRIDGESQAMLAAAWWPEGVTTPLGSAAAGRMHRFCLALPGLMGSIDPNAPYDAIPRLR